MKTNIFNLLQQTKNVCVVIYLSVIMLTSHIKFPQSLFFAVTAPSKSNDLCRLELTINSRQDEQSAFFPTFIPHFFIERIQNTVAIQ